MRFIRLAIACAVMAGCAPVNDIQPIDRSCRDGFAPLRFADGSASLAPDFTKALEWTAEMGSNCEIRTLTVVGLPDPSSESLAGRRSTAIAAVLRGFGLPTPTFDPGDAEAQAEPQLVIEAVPR